MTNFGPKEEVLPKSWRHPLSSHRAMFEPQIQGWPPRFGQKHSPEMTSLNVGLALFLAPFGQDPAAPCLRGHEQQGDRIVLDIEWNDFDPMHALSSCHHFDPMHALSSCHLVEVKLRFYDAELSHVQRKLPFLTAVGVNESGRLSAG
jgi:hypothetical protein